MQGFRNTCLMAAAIVGLSAVGAFAAPAGDNGATSPAASAPSNRPAGTVTTPMAPTGMTASPAASTPMARGGATEADRAGDDQANGGKMRARVEQRITELRGKLQISAAQEAQWDRFTEIMRDNARDMDSVFEARIQAMDTMNAEQNMKSYASIASHHARDVQRLVPAFDALYAKMSASQKKTADQVFREEANEGRRGHTG